jgi:hypothetical protein
VPSVRRSPIRPRPAGFPLRPRLRRPAAPTPVAWWKADSLALSNGAAVASWADSSGNGQTLAQATGTAQPTYVTNVVGGNPVVRFDGTTDFLDATITTRTQPNTWFVVFRPSSTAAMANVISGGEEIIVDAGGLVEVWGGASSVSDITATAGSWLSLGVQINGASSAIWSDNVAGTVGSLGTDPTGTALRVGNHSSLSRFFTGDIAEIILYNQVLSATDRASVFSYLHAKYLSGSAFTATVDDNAGISDAGQVRTLLATGTDDAGLTDQATSVLTPAGTNFTRTVDDSAGLSDPRALAQTATLSDAAGLTDTTAVASAFGRSQTDSAGLSDSLALTVTATATDAAGLTDQAVTASAFTRAQTDDAGISDATGQAVAYGRTVDDATGTTDSVATSGSLPSGVDNWWRADVLTLANADPVPTWTASAGGVDLTQATSGSRPTYRTNVINGLPVVRFDGTDDFLDATITSRAQPTTWFVVFKPATAGVLQNIIGGGQEILRDASTNAVVVYAGVTAASDVIADGSAWVILGVQVNGVSSAVWNGGTAGTIGDTGTDPTGTALRVGNHLSLSRNFAGDIAEIILYDRVLTTGERGQVFTYLNARYLVSEIARSVTDGTGLTDPRALAQTTTVNDTTGLNDIGDPAAAYAETSTDLVGLADSVTSSLAGAGTRTITDDAGLTDPRSIARAVTITDDTGLSDAGIAQGRTAAGTDPAGLTDSVSANLSTTFASRTVTDDAGISDMGAPQALDVAETSTDSTGLTDNVGVLAGGAAIRTVDDSTGLTDARTFAQTATLTDPVGLTDPRALAQTATLSDGAGITDSTSVSTAGAGTATVNDLAVTSDSLAFAQTGTVPDSAGLTDSTSAALERTLTDGAGLTDARVLDLASALTDGTGLSDGLAFERTVTATDGTGLTDNTSVQTAGAGTRQIDDPAGLADSLALAGTATVADGAGLADQVVAAGTFPRTQTDSAGITDAVIFDSVKAATPTDGTGLTDTIAGVSTFGRAQNDNAGLTDTITLAMVNARTADDSAGLADVTATAMVVLRALTDGTGLTDLASGGLASLLNQTVTDRAGFTDTVAAANVLQPTVTGTPQVTGDTAGPGVTGDRVPAGVT